jgi:trimeric autotransporter adhesin
MHRPQAIVALLAACAADCAMAQCALQWQTGGSVPGLNTPGVLDMTRWDPDGAGPLAERLVITGHFAAAGTAAAQNLVAFDPATGAWTSFGSGISGTLEAAIAEPGGGLVVGGTFTAAGGIAAANIARWNGTGWQALGSGINGTVFALAVMPNGNVIAGGQFTTAGGQAIANLARWDGSQWSALGGNVNGTVVSLACLPNGDLIASGGFTQINGQPVAFVGRWDGTTWHAMGTGTWGATGVLAVGPNGEVCAHRQLLGGGYHVARWTGSVWQSLGQAFGSVHDLGFDGQGALHAAGSFTSLAGVPANALARYTNGQWQAIPVGSVTILNHLECWSNGDLFVGGPFLAIGSTTASGLARWDGSTWHALATGTQGSSVYAIHERGNGDLVIGGGFTQIGGVPARGVATWNGTTWQALGSGWLHTVRAITEFQGDLVVGGYVQDPAAFPNYRHIARWDGSQWHSLGSGVDYDVLTMLTRGNGDLLVGGMFATAGGIASPGLARWDGTNWHAFAPGLIAPPGGTNPNIHCLVELPNGELLVAGSFRVLINGTWYENIARWDGAAWHGYGASLNVGVKTVALLPNGEMVAGGSFTTSGATPVLRIARWNGTQWTAMGGGVDSSVQSVVTLPDGSVAVGGYFTNAGAQYAPRLMRCTVAGQWSWFGGGPNDVVTRLHLRRNGDLLAGGFFSVAGGQVAMLLTSLQPSCRATTTTLPHACTAAPTPRPLEVQELPWTGGTFRARAAGLAPGSFAMSVFGFATPPTPIASLLAIGSPGCVLHTTIVSLGGGITNDGTLATALPIPNSASLAGFTCRHQVFELTAGTPGEVRANDALDLVVGRF